VEERAKQRLEQRAQRAADRSRWRAKRREREGGRTTEPAATADTNGERRPSGQRKVRQGVVVSSKPNKTITVRLDLIRSHPVYGKVVRTSRTLHAHDEQNQAGEGDVVRVIECRPLSRTKRWRLLEVVQRAR
jgi:small subunit ribosomal protein S17